MVVDDEELSRRFIVSCLNWEAFGLEISSEAASGLEALTLLEEQTPDIIFTDIKMPYMDGLELSRLITEKYPLPLLPASCPIIFRKVFLLIFRLPF